MDLRWLQQINVDVDANGRAVALQALVSLLSEVTGLTFLDPVPIDQSVAGWTKLAGKADGVTNRVHLLIGTMNPGGTLTVVSNPEDDGSGADTQATGAMPLGAMGGCPIPPIYVPAFCPKSQAGEALGIRTTGGTFHGYAVVSTD